MLQSYVLPCVVVIKKFLDCRYQGINWRDKTNWGCNQRMNPTGERWMDGITISPHELMFVKVKDHLLLSTNSLAIAARKYSDWMDGMVRAPF